MTKKNVLYSENNIIQLVFHTKKRIAIESQNNLFPTLEIQFPVLTPFAKLLGNWIAEFRGNEILLRQRNGSFEDWLDIFFESAPVNVDVAVQKDNGKYTTSKYENVERLEVYLEIVLYIAEKMQDSTPASQTTEDNHSVTLDQTALSQLQETNARLQQLLDAKIEDFILSARNDVSTLSEKQQAALVTLEQLKSEHKAVGESFDRTLKMCSTIQNDIARINQTISTTSDEIADNEAKKASLETELESLRAKKEFLDLDCSKAMEEADEMRIRLDCNKNSFSVLEDDSILKHGSVTSTLKQMEKEISAIERRIAAIIKYRTTFNEAVEESMFHGDGTISSIIEAGGNVNGNRSSTSETD